MPIIQNAIYPENKPGIAHALEAVLSGVGQIAQSNRDKAYRKSAAKLLGVAPEDLGYFQREEIKDLIKERYKTQFSPKEWKPTTKEEALIFEKAKKENNYSTQAREKEAEIRLKIERGEPITKREKQFYEASSLNKIIPKDYPILEENTEQVQEGGSLGSLLRNMFGLNKNTQDKTAISEFTPEEELLITENMTAHKKPREEVIKALKTKGYLKGI